MKATSFALLLLSFRGAAGHGQLNMPPSRNKGSLDLDGRCNHHLGRCSWFSHLVEIPESATLPTYARTYNVEVVGGPRDYSAKAPWRSPGAAPVYGSGCGIMGGYPHEMPIDGAVPGDNFKQGFDGVHLNSTKSTVWRRGGVVEVAWGIGTNHGGGYSYRLCKKTANISESCFQRHVLRFFGNSSWLQWGQAVKSRIEVPLVRVTEGTFPRGSEWARNPIPSCKICNISDCPPGGPPGSPAYVKQQTCVQYCAGGGPKLPANTTSCPRDAKGTPRVQFEEPKPGISGYLWVQNIDSEGETFGSDYNLVDRVIVPADLELGDYLLSWRWDAEGTHQVWQNCADVTVLDADEMVHV